MLVFQDLFFKKMPDKKIPDEKIRKIIEKVKLRLRPEKEIFLEVDKTVNKINEVIKKLNIEADCVKGGSIAKNTFLKNDCDIDLFVRFAFKYEDSKLSDMLYEILITAFSNVKILRVHGSRDYFQFRINNYDYEIVPVLMLHESNLRDARNITDFSPLHVNWVSGKIKKNPELSDEIRVAKQFCKANNVYGAESYIKGFSGHILDIMVIHYGSFISMVKAFASIDKISIQNPIIIDAEKKLVDPLKQLNKNKINYLIVIDPVQPERNAAAALSREKLQIFISKCKKFIESPSEKFFNIEKFDLNKALKDFKSKYKNCKIIVFKVKTQDGSKDIAGTKVYKVYFSLIKHSELNDFKVIDSTWHFDYEKKHAILILCYNNEKLSEAVEHKGPPLNALEDVKRFRKKYAQTKIVGNRIFAIIKRTYLYPEDLLRKLIEEKFITSRVKKIVLEKIIIN